MRAAILIIILLIFNQTCKSQDFNIKYENIEINIPGKPGPWLKYNGKFYWYFKTDNDKYSTGSTNHFYILDENGKIELKIAVPEKLQTFYYDLYVKNDTIFTTDYYEKHTFYLKQNKWIETKKAIDLYYEDDNYYVYSLDFGEWGSVSWFHDRITNKQYEFAASNPIINKLENTYFITLATKIIKIENPKDMELSNEPYDYNKAVLTKNYFRNGSNALEGTEIIYEYKNNDYFNPKFSFATSFISNGKVYHLFKDSISTKIGIIENRKLVKVYDFKNDKIPYRWSYGSRNQIQKNGLLSVQFSTRKTNEYGILEINDNNILVTTFKNSFKEPEMGEVKMKQWFEKYFDYFFSNFDRISLQDIDSIEQKENATDITQRHKISHYLLDGKDIETPRIYRKIENSILKLNTTYYYTTNQKFVELIEFEWGKNNSNVRSINKNKSDSIYNLKFEWISNYLSNKLGKPYTDIQKSKTRIQEWKIEDKVVKLAFNENSVQLTMYRQ